MAGTPNSSSSVPACSEECPHAHLFEPTFTATVVAAGVGAGTPTGRVTFAFVGGTPSVMATLSGGLATVTHTYTTTTGGPFTVTATYSGDTSFTASTGTDTQT
ncbi:Ig-like domain repeat protein [Streptomyces sp. NPDC046197]|uniref:Ig-like domain repeat protein n=1 Tax=Streptomyces sp. NPDC046197 TaxID=3154337 RepID=UPI0033C60CFD